MLGGPLRGPPEGCAGPGDRGLIAAAPDLLEAAKEALAVVDECYRATGHFKVADTSGQRERLRAAIQKAEG